MLTPLSDCGDTMKCCSVEDAQVCLIHEVDYFACLFNVSGEVLSIVKFLTHDWTITVEESKENNVLRC